AHGGPSPWAPAHPPAGEPAAQGDSDFSHQRNRARGGRAHPGLPGRRRGRPLCMKWFLGAILFLLIALILESGLLAYAMYVLLAVMVLSRVLARSWIGNLSATRRCEQTTAEIGDEVEVELTVRNAGRLPVPWVLLEDLLPRAATNQRAPRLKVQGKRLQVR